MPNHSAAALRPMGTPRPWLVEQRLFRSWRSGDREAGRELLERLCTHLQRFFGARCGALADDMVQETLLACVRARETLADEAALKSYVYTTARRILARELARHRGEAVELDELPADDADLHTGYERSAAVARLRVQLRAQPTVCTRAAELYFLEGHRGPEIAALLEISEGTVRSRIRRGLGQLRRALDGSELPSS